VARWLLRLPLRVARWKDSMPTYRCFQCDDEFIHKTELNFRWFEFCSMRCFNNRVKQEQRYYDEYADI
jgi:hypothetical protein